MKKIVLGILVLTLLATGYYLFVRTYEFEVNFQAKTLPGDVIETIRIWNRSLSNSKIVEVDSVYELKQLIVQNQRQYVYDWHFVLQNDSVTKVNIRMSEPGRSIMNKLLIPFTEQPIEKDGSEMAKTIYEILKEHVRITSVKVIGESELDSTFCVCRSLTTSQVDKANGMMKDYPLLTSFVDNHGLKPIGPPSVRVKEWNHTKGVIAFDFCFSIVKGDSLPMIDSLVYRDFSGEKVLKAEYHGNYITSDRAWYELVQYAATNGYTVRGLPIEYFHNNPNTGINEIEWKAEVYLPVEKK